MWADLKHLLSQQSAVASPLRNESLPSALFCVAYLADPSVLNTNVLRQNSKEFTSQKNTGRNARGPNFFCVAHLYKVNSMQPIDVLLLLYLL